MYAGVESSTYRYDDDLDNNVYYNKYVAYFKLLDANGNYEIVKFSATSDGTGYEYVYEESSSPCSFSTEQWVFTLGDGTTVTKNVHVG